MKIQKGMISNGRTGGAGGVNSGSTMFYPLILAMFMVKQSA